jgi:hypothetical protein
MRLIPLSRGLAAKVDDADFDWLNQWKWYAARRRKGEETFYAARSARTPEGKKFTIWMHREIARTPEGLETDHKNQDSLDNQRINLRPSTRSQNQWNRRLPKNNTSGVMGVAWRKDREKWHAKIALFGRDKHIGYFETRIAAQKAVEAAREARC